MLISLTACGTTATQQNATQTTTQYETEEHENEQEPQDPPAEDPDGGYWHDEEPSSTEEPVSPTEEPSSTEEPTDNPPTGAYTYNVDGVQITLRTNIEDYISVRSSGAYQVNLLGIAESLGFEIMGTMADGTPYELRKIHNFYLIGNHDYTVWLADEQDQGYYSVCGRTGVGDYIVNFTRSDISNDSVTTYWVDNGDELAPVKTVSFSEIVIFTYLLENIKYSPSEDWLGNTGLSHEANRNLYYINE